MLIRSYATWMVQLFIFFLILMLNLLIVFYKYNSNVNPNVFLIFYLSKLCVIFSLRCYGCIFVNYCSFFYLLILMWKCISHVRVRLRKLFYASKGLLLWLIFLVTPFEVLSCSSLGLGGKNSLGTAFSAPL